MLAIVSGPSPVFVSVAVFGADGAPTATAPNPRLAGVSVTTGAVPVPLRATANGPPASVVIVSVPVRGTRGRRREGHLDRATRSRPQRHPCSRS